MKKNLIEVRPNVYLSKSDPDFLRKYLLYHPDDAEHLYAYAQLWKKKNQLDKYEDYLRKAGGQGHAKAKQELKKNQRVAQSMTASLLLPEKKVDSEEKWLKRGLYTAILLFLLWVLFALLYGFTDLFHHREVENHYYQTEQRNYYHSNETADAQEGTVSAETMPLLLTKSAVDRYKELHDSYPRKLSTLQQPYPDNHISSLPDVKFSSSMSGYSLELPPGQTMPTTPLELVFFPATNQLALTTGDTVVVVYEVASGRLPLPFTEAIVEKRVVNPNGGTGVLGTRGLVLQDNYAIHGTDSPELIGQYVSDGCIRLSNPDIEELYPYVPVGTPFSVKQGTPGPPALPNGLPAPPPSANGNGGSSKDDDSSPPPPPDSPSSPGNSDPEEPPPGEVFHWKY